MVLRIGPREPWEEHRREYHLVRCEPIKQGNFSKVYRRQHKPDGRAPTLVVIKELRHQAELTQQEEHELQCIRLVNDHRFRGHVIKLLNVFHKVESVREVAHIIVMESGICSLLHIQSSGSEFGTSTVQTWIRSLARAVQACHESQVMHRDIKPGNCIMCVGQQATLDLNLADFGNSVVVTTGPPISGASFELEWSTTPEYCAPELFRGFHSFRGDVWSIGVICSELLHIQPGVVAVRSEGNPRDENGIQGWQAAAMKHSQNLQDSRGTEPLVSGLMGVDMCVGCCRMDVCKRLSAEEVANHPFILSNRTWTPEMDMISDLAPLLLHMAPGDLWGPGSHEWMMTTLPETHRKDWALELIGSLIKYPFAVQIFVRLASKLKPQYTAKSLVGVLLETAVQAADCLTPGSQTTERCRRQMKVLDAQGVCRFQGLPRILQKLGLLKKSHTRLRRR